MRILGRIFGLTIIWVFFSLIILQLVLFNIYQDKLTSSISAAVSSTQIVMQEQIEDREFGTNTRRKTISSNEEYIKEFTRNFYLLMGVLKVKRNPDGSAVVNASGEVEMEVVENKANKLNIKVWGIDYEKGFLDVSVDSTFIMFNGQPKTISSRKTSFVEILQP